MSTLPSFFRTFWYSSTSLKFYRQLLHTPIQRSWWFFVRAFALFALLFTVALCVPLALFDLDPVIYKAYSIVQESYPDELVITLENGKYSINQELPYAIPMPQFVIEDLKKSMRSEDYSNLVVFTTDEAVGTNVYNLDALDAPIVATESRIYALSDDRKQFYVVKDLLADIKEGSSFVIDEQFVRSFPITKLTESPYLSRAFYVPVIGVVILLVSISIFLLINSIAALVYALIALGLFTLILHKRALPYTQILQCTLHLLVPIFVLRVFTMFMMIPFGFLFWLGVYLVAMAFIHKSLHRTTAVDSKVAAVNSHVKTKSLTSTGSKKVTSSLVSRKKPSAGVVKKTGPKKSTVVVKKAAVKKSITPAKKTVSKKVAQNKELPTAVAPKPANLVATKKSTTVSTKKPIAVTVVPAKKMGASSKKTVTNNVATKRNTVKPVVKSQKTTVKKAAVKPVNATKVPKKAVKPKAAKKASVKRKK